MTVLECPHCKRELPYSGEPPSFCGYCRTPLEASSQHSQDASTIPGSPPAQRGDKPPAEIGGYRLRYKLGSGGMGAVYEAEHTASGRRVAIKLLSRRFSTDPQQIERFRQEGRLASQINHPRAVFVYAADEEQGQPYIVMELMPGMTLEDQVKGQGPLPVADAISRTLEIIDGLQEAHRLGVLHRDVKPSNCFLLDDGSVKVGDFGLSKVLGQHAAHTEAGAYKGTVIYSPPEQLRDEAVDFRADVYSVTATLFFMLTGRAPFEGTSHIVAAARSASQPAPDVRTLRPDVPAGLAGIVQRGLHIDRDRRYQNLDDLRRALGSLMPGQQTAAGLGLRAGAFLIDQVVLSARFLLPPMLAMLGVSLHPLASYAMLLPIVVAYFAILEGHWGWTPGKRLLRLRVCRADGIEPPGWKAAAVRALILVLAFFIPRSAIELLPSSWPANILTAIQALSTTLAMFMVIWPIRLTNQYRGWHELISGTRVVQLAWPEPRFKYESAAAPAPTAPIPPDLPTALGPFTVAGVVAKLENRMVLAAEDRALGRRVHIELHDPTQSQLRRHDLARPNRLRWLMTGNWENLTWDAYIAPAGAPIRALVQRGSAYTWAQARPVLEQLSEELCAAAKDGSLPFSLSLDQVWVSPEGLVQVLDAPILGNPTQSDTPIQLLQAAAVLLLEGQAMREGEVPRSIKAAVPGHVTSILERLMGLRNEIPTPEGFRADLEATRSLPRRVTFIQKAAYLTVLSILLSIGLGFMYAGNFAMQYVAKMDPANVSKGIGYINMVWEVQSKGPQTNLRVIGAALSVPAIFWPALWTLWAFCFRGGIALRMMNLKLVRSDGRAAWRLQCAFRALLVWTPVTLLLLLTNLISAEGEDFSDIARTLWFCSIGLLAVYAYASLLNPTRAVHDWLTGTTLVPT